MSTQTEPPKVSASPAGQKRKRDTPQKNGHATHEQVAHTAAGSSSSGGPSPARDSKKARKEEKRKAKEDRKAQKHNVSDETHAAVNGSTSPASALKGKGKAEDVDRSGKAPKARKEKRNSLTRVETAPTEADDTLDTTAGSISTVMQEPASPSTSRLLSADSRVSRSDPPQSAYRQVFPLVTMPVPPRWASDPSRAVAELLDTMIMKYVPALQGVLITHDQHSRGFQTDLARVDGDSAFAVAPIGVPCIVWGPQIGMRLEGKIILSSPSHVSLLLQGIFNASISAPHISLKHWEFVHDDTAASDRQSGSENDSQEGQEEEQESDATRPTTGSSRQDVPQSWGYWRNKKTGARLGGADGKITFTVISMTVASGMLSVHGSYLKRPFSVPPPDEEAKRNLALVPGLTVQSGGTTAGERRTGGAEAGAGPRKSVRWQAESDWDKFPIPGRGDYDDEEEEDEFGYVANKRASTPAPKSSAGKRSGTSKANRPPKGIAPPRAKAAGAAVPSQGKKTVFAD